MFCTDGAADEGPPALPDVPFGTLLTAFVLNRGPARRKSCDFEWILPNKSDSLLETENTRGAPQRPRAGRAHGTGKTQGVFEGPPFEKTG